MHENTNDNNASEIYFVTFEEYLKPKKAHKTRKLQQFHGSNIKQETELQLKHLDIAIPETKVTNSKASMKNNLKVVHTRNKKTLEYKDNLNTKNDKSKPKATFGRFLQALHPRKDDGTCKRKSGFEIYCELASVHGFVNFIHANIWQRIFWTLVICFAVCMCCIIVLMSHFMNQRNPTVFYTEGIAYPAWTVPLPAVTICNLNRISKFEAEKVANKLLKQSLLSHNEILQLFPLALYASHEVNGTQRDFLALEMLLKPNNYTIDQLVYDISPKCESDEYRFCKIMGHFEHCKRIVTEVLTVVGVCCAHTYLGLKTTPANQDPIYSTSVGPETGLTILVDPDVGNYTFSGHKFYGYKIFLHDSYDAIDGLSSQLYVLARTETFVGVTPSSAYGTRYLRGRSIQSRRCYFADERKLVNFRFYSQTNCLIECRSLLMDEKCGCLPTFWPKLNNKWHYCQLATEINCVLDNKEIFSQMMVDSSSHAPKSHEKCNIICDCLPSCDTNKYTSVVEAATLDRNFTLVQKRFFKSLRRVGDLILLHIFYEDLISERYRLDVSENWLSFMGTFGGIAGLYMGYSVVSGFEIIFFTLIRPACNWLTKQQIKYRLRKRRISVNQDVGVK